MWLVIANILSFVLISVLMFYLLSKLTLKKSKLNILQTKTYNKISDYIFIARKKKLLSNKISKINPLTMIFLMIVIFIIAFVIFYSYLKVVSTSLILSIPFLISPILFINILINKEKSNIIKILPMYIVNVKNHIDEDNNIISAIQRTTVEEPLKKYIDIFKSNISRGMKVIEAFENLKQEVNVKIFDTFITACITFYLNGGDFNNVLEQYINMITKENIHKESTKEKAYSDILTLIIMVVLNILVIVMFVFTNEEYSQIIRETFLGRLILNFNAFSYILIAYLISRIYKEE